MNLCGILVYTVDQHDRSAPQGLSVDILVMSYEAEKRIASCIRCRSGLESIYIMYRYTDSLNVVFSAPTETRNRVGALCIHLQ